MASSVVALAHSTAGLIYCLSMFDHTELREEPKVQSHTEAKESRFAYRLGYHRCHERRWKT
jgi:hypothetical protein